MYAFGSTIDCLVNASSGCPAFFAAALRLSRSGPTLPVAAGIGVNVWQAPQPFWVKIVAPALAPAPPAGLGGLSEALYQVSKSAVDWTIDQLRITAWPRPQSSVQITGNLPSRS